MKRILYRCVLVATILTGGVLAYATWRAMPATAQDYFESGKKYFDKQQYQEAIIQLQNSLKKDAGNREARRLLAISYFNQNDLNSAAKELLAILEYFPGDVEANLRLANIYLTAGSRDSSYFRKAADIARDVLSRNPDDASALILLGNATAGLQDYHSAIELFEKAIPLDPQNGAAFVSLGTTQALQKHYPEAEKAFLQALRLDPKNKSALIALANYYRAIQDYGKAEATWKDALAAYPADKEVYFGAVDFYYQQDRLPEIDRILREAQAKSDKDPAPALFLAEIYAAKDRVADAQNLLLDLEKRFPENIDVAGQLAASLMKDQPSQAQTRIDRIMKSDPKKPLGPVLLGELQFLTGKFEEAQATLGKPPALEAPYPQVHFFLGSISERNGKLDEAQDHYLKSIALNGLYMPSRVGLAQVFFKKGRLADAKQEIHKVLDARPAFTDARLLKSTIDAAENNHPEAEREFTALLKEQPKNPAVYRQAGLYYESRGRIREAQENLSRALDLAPDSVEILGDVVSFFIRNNATDQAVQKINEIPEQKKRAAHYELLGLAHFEGGRLSDAETAYKKALDLDPQHSAAGVYLVGVYIRAGRMDEAMKKLDEMIAKNPSYASAYGARGFIYQTQNKVEEAKQSYSQALKIDPDLDSAANNYAYILANEGQDLQTALSWAQIARRKQPENPDYAGTLGWVQYKMGRYTLARDQLQFAASKQPENPAYQYHLAMIYRETKQMPEAQAALKRAIGSSQDFKEKALAEQALKEIAVRR